MKTIETHEPNRKSQAKIRSILLKIELFEDKLRRLLRRHLQNLNDLLINKKIVIPLKPKYKPIMPPICDENSSVVIETRSMNSG